mmetsp:Transcript_113094/g.205658  ORF Transcript_113094/g.205658 Transcript_113094/m.205658 type:complete len:724 (-) Transcript_113094:26-2197(-)
MRAHKSHARNIAMTHMGGEVFTVAEEPSDNAVLWGELFGSKERKFLRELLSSQTVCFTLADTYQIFVRTLFHSEAFITSKNGAGMRRAGKFVLMLHALDGDLTSSWTWAKFIRPMYRNNFSVILVDLPGFGKSTVSRTSYCPISRWKEYDFHIISKILEELGIPKCHICAVGTGCGILVRMLQRAAHRLEDEHFMLNPVLDPDELFAHVGVQPGRGAAVQQSDPLEVKMMVLIVSKNNSSVLDALKSDEQVGCFVDQLTWPDSIGEGRDGARLVCRPEQRDRIAIYLREHGALVQGETLKLRHMNPCHILVTDEFLPVVEQLIDALPRNVRGKLEHGEEVKIPSSKGEQAGRQERKREDQQKALMDLMRKTGVKLWLAFDRGVSYGVDDRRINDKRSGNWKRQFDTHVMFTSAAKNPFVGKNTVITEVMRADVCDAQLGQQVKVRALIPSRNLKASVAKFFTSQNDAKWAENFTPHHKKQLNASFRHAQLQTRALGSGMDFGDSDSDDGVQSRQAPLALENGTAGRGAQTAGQRALLALMPPGEAQSHTELALMGDSHSHETSPEFLRQKRTLEERMRPSPTADSRNRSSSGSRAQRSMFHSTSDSALGKSKMESALLSGSNFARRLLKSRGARPETGQPLPPSTKHHEEYDWSHAPFENDLSYGVRNMFMEAFEASVKTFKEEEEARVAHSKVFAVRTGFHRASARSLASFGTGDLGTRGSR